MKYCLTFWDAAGQDWLLGPVGAARAGSFSVFFKLGGAGGGGGGSIVGLFGDDFRSVAIYQRK